MIFVILRAFVISLDAGLMRTASAFRFRQQIRAHDVALRRVTDELERIARHERHHRVIRRIEHVRVVRIDDGRLAYAIPEHAIRRGQNQWVANLELANRSENRIAMTGDADIPTITGERSAVDASGSRTRSRTKRKPIRN